jgi:putative membrane protein
MKRILILASCVWLAAAGPALAQYSSQPPSDRERRQALRAKGLTPDSAFVIAAAQSAFASAAFASMAADKASSPDVKTFAKQIAADTGRMAEELKPMLKAQRAPEPTAFDERNKAVHDWLAKLSGPAFDRAYISNMSALRAGDVMVFGRAATRAHHADVKAWASKKLPRLEADQRSAKEIRVKIH